MKNKDNGNCNPTNKFIEIYEQSIIESLLIFGHHFAGIISLHLKEKYSISRLGDTVYNPRILTDAMECLMDASAIIIQRRIIRLVYHRIGIELSFSYDFNFEERILNAKKEFENRYSNQLN
ncbi:MAG TPA: hypothetical protein VN703_05605 [Candidatus Sulfopaludibacter sp.]|nr:hypothetical protein [Candidatus Sulfopaludibacter sp.]